MSNGISARLNDSISFAVLQHPFRIWHPYLGRVPNHNWPANDPRRPPSARNVLTGAACVLAAGVGGSLRPGRTQPPRQSLSRCRRRSIHSRRRMCSWHSSFTTNLRSSSLPYRNDRRADVYMKLGFHFCMTTRTACVVGTLSIVQLYDPPDHPGLDRRAIADITRLPEVDLLLKVKVDTVVAPVLHCMSRR